LHHPGDHDVSVVLDSPRRWSVIPGSPTHSITTSYAFEGLGLGVDGGIGANCDRPRLVAPPTGRTHDDSPAGPLLPPRDHGQPNRSPRRRPGTLSPDGCGSFEPRAVPPRRFEPRAAARDRDRRESTSPRWATPHYLSARAWAPAHKHHHVGLYTWVLVSPARPRQAMAHSLRGPRAWRPDSPVVSVSAPVATISPQTLVPITSPQASTDGLQVEPQMPPGHLQSSSPSR